MKNMIKTITKKTNELVFGVRVKGEKLQTPTLRTLHIKERPSKDEWLKEFRCSLLYNKKPVYIS